MKRLAWVLALLLAGCVSPVNYERPPVELPEADDLRSLAVALEIERMIREGRGETAWPEDLPWSVRSA